MVEHCEMVDSGKCFRVDAKSRTVKVPLSSKVIGTVGDHLSEIKTFRIPKTIDGKDIKGCAEHYLTWKIANGDEGDDNLDLVSEDAEWLYYTWKIRGNTAVKDGIVSFSLHFEDYTNEGVLAYRWSTTPCTDCEILEGLNTAVSTYQSIYVVGDTLVFDDYTPVRDKTIVLESAEIHCQTVHVKITHEQPDGDEMVVSYHFLDEQGRLQQKEASMYTGIIEFDAIAGTCLIFSTNTNGVKTHFSIDGTEVYMMDTDGTHSNLTYMTYIQPYLNEYSISTILERETGT